MDIQLPEDAELLKLTQKVRLRLVNSMTADGMVPSCTKEIKALATVLKDIDGQVQFRQRLEQDGTDAKNDREVALQIAQVSLHIARNSVGNPFKAGNAAAVGGKDDSALPEIEILPGQTDVGVSNTTFRDFMKEHGVSE